MSAATIAPAIDDLASVLTPPMCDAYGDADEHGECSTHRAEWFGRAGCGHDRLLCSGHRAHFVLLVEHLVPLECAQCSTPVASLAWVKL